jgi:hypothetical protein
MARRKDTRACSQVGQAEPDTARRKDTRACSQVGQAEPDTARRKDTRACSGTSSWTASYNREPQAS